MEFEKIQTLNPLEHAKKIEDILASLKQLCKSERDIFSDIRAKVLLDTSAEVLNSLEKLFHDYQQNIAWEEEYENIPQKSSDPWD